ncbi:hypothetical protein llap_11880 [Limosa lapponica baueri]|uniref:Uncharacterized protein n=1 Tax=Limosa lapponica baueri TaxID=1758121 RepID=A0A2I0TVJ2_LIMLA|nr:hypothetical protein llap_11880 [Limosa lapponica baueri]
MGIIQPIANGNTLSHHIVMMQNTNLDLTQAKIDTTFCADSPAATGGTGNVGQNKENKNINGSFEAVTVYPRLGVPEGASQRWGRSGGDGIAFSGFNEEAVPWSMGRTGSPGVWGVAKVRERDAVHLLAEGCPGSGSHRIRNMLVSPVGLMKDEKGSTISHTIQ